MKRFLCAIFMLALFPLAFAAGVDEIVVKEGSPAVLKDGGKVYLKVDWESCTWDKKGSIKNTYDEWGMLSKQGRTELIEEFNDEAEKSRIVDNRAEAKYEMSIKFENADHYWNWFTECYIAKLWCTVTIKEIATGKKVCVLYMDECSGGNALTTKKAFLDTMEELGKQLGKIFKKGKV